MVSFVKKREVEMLPLESLDSLVMLGLTPYSSEQIRLLKALKTRSMFKFICGASYRDFDSVKKYSEIFSRAGAHVISVSAHPTVVIAAHEGISNSEASPDERPVIMVSVSLDHNSDPRFKRVVVDMNACDNCGACISVCPTSAFNQDSKNKTFSYEKEKCFGCAECLPSCHADAFSLESVNPLDPTTLPELWSLGARCLEIHVGPNFYWLESYIKRIREISSQSWVFSVVLSAEHSSYADLQEQAREVYNLLGDGALIQVDGLSSLVPHNKNESSALKAIAAASTILDLGLPIFVQIAGGIDEKVRPLCSQFNIEINGVGMGSYCRKLIEPHLSDKATAVAIAKRVIKNVSPVI